MQKYINNFLSFYRKYRWWVIGGLFFLLMMQICSEGGRVNSSNTGNNVSIASEGLENDLLRPIDELGDETQIKPQSNNFNSLFTLLIAGLLFYFALKRGLLKKIIPSIIWVSIGIKRIKGQRLAKISIVNQTKESQTLQAPVIVLSGIGKKTRRFKIKTGINTIFPITLTPSTSHRLSIDIDQFRGKANLPRSYRFVKIELESNGLKKHSSFWNVLF